MYQKNYSFDPNTKSNTKHHYHHHYQISEKMDKSVNFANQIKVNSKVGISQGPEKSQQTQSSACRVNFILAFIPLILWGFPVHLLFRRQRISSTREWLKYLCPCSSPFSSILTTLLAIYSIAIVLFAVYTLGRFLYMILITAVVNEDIVQIVVDIVRMAPVVIPLSLFWLNGYKLKNFMVSFDWVALTWDPVDVDRARFTTIPTGRIKLFLMHWIILIIHILGNVGEYFRKDSSVLGTTQAVSTTSLAFEITMIYSDAIGIYFTLILQIYSCFCWAILYELDMVKVYIQSLIGSRVVPKYAHFDEIKVIFRKIADDILIVNSLFSVFLSVVAFLLGTYVYGEVQNLGITVFNAVSTYFNGQSREVLAPNQVRLIVADVVGLVLYCVLLGITYWQAVTVNDAVRLLHVWLNDFVTEPESRLSSEMHDAFELLKWYIHSRLEQEKPALLWISVISLAPMLKTRMLQYRVIH